MILCGLACRRQESPQTSFARVYQTFVRGELEQSQENARREFQSLRSSDPEWAWRFRTLEAKSLLWRGMYGQVLSTLDSPAAKPSSKDSQIEIFALQGATLARLHKFPEAEQAIEQAERMCEASSEATCGDVLLARGVMAVQRGQLDLAKQSFQQALDFGRAHRDDFLQATALLNLGATSLQEEHFDAAIDWTDAAYQAAQTHGFGNTTRTALGNLGWAYYKLGDYEKSLELSVEAEKRASQVGNFVLDLYWTTNLGYVYASLGDFARAQQSYLKALDLATRINSKEGAYNAVRALALVSVQSGELDQARKYSDQAISIARADRNRLNELYPLLVKGLIAAQSQNRADAHRIFEEVRQDPTANASLQWRADRGLAHLYEEENRPDLADHEYRAALTRFEGARASLTRNDAKLPFSANAAGIYGDYIHFLVERGKSEEALHWADYSRARTLAEGLRTSAKESRENLTLATSTNSRDFARHVGGIILFYWLGEKQSYLWAVTPQKTNLYSLPPASEIDAAVQRYRKALAGPQDVLESADRDGRYLYQTLIAPARSALPQNANIFIIPDGSLNNLNFETLLVPDPKLHYWIEDATITNASSLRLLGASSSEATAKPGRKLLLVGNSIAPNDRYPELPKASAQMDSVASHFSPEARQILTRDQATPAAYFSSDPSQFSFIHFVAHGTASRLSPLDSAIVLSKSSAEDDSFKLYARDIVRRPLRAQLVTISSCYGAGERAYSGEGLVGLSWAFLRAGAHNVIAALWEASDASTEQLMQKFYDEIEQGRSPDAALRAAKLSLLHGNSFHSPFYWAPFQLYVGSSAGSRANSRFLQAGSHAPSH
jgi:CHAT domain-containing protein/Flp pilus assembly protein TadD